MIRSLRMRLFLGTTLVSAILLTILCITITQAVEGTLRGEFDDVLREKARALASMVDQHGTEVIFDYQRQQFPEFEAGPHPAYFEILLEGKPYQRSPSLAEGDLPVSAAARHAGVPEAITLPNGREGRWVSVKFTPIVESDDVSATPLAIRKSGVLAVAQDTGDLSRTLSRIRWLAFSMCAGATLLSGIALLLVVRRAVGPVDELARQIALLRETDLSGKFDAGRLPTELVPVVERLNELVARLNEAFTRERAFTADAAHELRTPLAGLLTTLEVCRTRPRNAPEYEIAIDKCLAMLSRMKGMAEKLLLLSRAEGGQVTVRTAPVDAGLMISECWQAFETPARSRGLIFEMAGAEHVTISADAELMRIVLSNLFDNAVSYSRPNGVIRANLSAHGDRVIISVENTGHALTDVDVPRLFERFWRKDAARTGSGVHAGLGLSLCQRLMLLQGGTIVAKLKGEHFLMELDLPGANNAESHEAKTLNATT